MAPPKRCVVVLGAPGPDETGTEGRPGLEVPHAGATDAIATNPSAAAAGHTLRFPTGTTVPARTRHAADALTRTGGGAIANGRGRPPS